MRFYTFRVDYPRYKAISCFFLKLMVSFEVNISLGSDEQRTYIYFKKV